MPTILQILGWRLFFYAHEGNEPIHIHAIKGNIECKYWIKQDEYEIELAYEYNLKPSAKREIKKIIYQHFDYIINEWNEFFNKN